MSYNTWGASWGVSWGISWGTTSAPTPTPTPVTRDQGAGHGRKNAFESLEQYKKMGEIIAQSKILPTKTPKPKLRESKIINTLAELPKIISVLPEATISLADVERLGMSLEQINLQEQEDEAIAFLMLATIH